MYQDTARKIISRKFILWWDGKIMKPNFVNISLRCSHQIYGGNPFCQWSISVVKQDILLSCSVFNYFTSLCHEPSFSPWSFREGFNCSLENIYINKQKKRTQGKETGWRALVHNISLSWDSLNKSQHHHRGYNIFFSTAQFRTLIRRLETTSPPLKHWCNHGC